MRLILCIFDEQNYYNSCLDVSFSSEMKTIARGYKENVQMSSCKINCALTGHVALCAPAPVFLTETRDSDTFQPLCMMFYEELWVLPGVGLLYFII